MVFAVSTRLGDTSPLFVVSRDGYWTTTLMLYVVVFVIAVLIAVRRGKSLSPKALFERMVQF